METMLSYTNRLPDLRYAHAASKVSPVPCHTPHPSRVSRWPTKDVPLECNYLGIMTVSKVSPDHRPPSLPSRPTSPYQDREAYPLRPLRQERYICLNSTQPRNTAYYSVYQKPANLFCRNISAYREETLAGMPILTKKLCQSHMMTETVPMRNSESM